MSKAKKALLSLAAVAALAVGGLKVKQHMDYIHEGTPYLKGKCFLMEDSTGLAIADVVKLQDESGKEVEVYVGVIVVGPFQIPQPLDIRKTNKGLPEMVKAGQAQEVNCETGEPVSK